MKRNAEIVPSSLAKGFFPLFSKPIDLFADDWAIMPKASGGVGVSEDKEHVYVEAPLPGLKQEDIEVTFDKGVLWIKGDARENEEDKEKKYYYRLSRTFSYCISVPGEIDMTAEPEANFRNGLMTVAFRKTQKEQPRKIKISGNGG